MAVKKRPKKKHKQSKPHGHYCWVCGEHKANEKFSGRGHATHMCKKCHALPVAERNKIVAIRKAENMAFRYLSEQEINWLRRKMNDPRPEVQEAARKAHKIKFPRYERNRMKKGLKAFSLELFIHGEMWGECGGAIDAHMFVSMNHNGIIRRTDYDAPESERETEVSIDAKEAQKIMQVVIHDLDALFWDEDLSDAEPGGYDPCLDILPEYRVDFDGDDIEFNGDDEEVGNAEPETPAVDREPLWSLCLELNNGEDKRITFYNQMHDAPQELFWALMELFEPDGGSFDI